MKKADTFSLEGIGLTRKNYLWNQLNFCYTLRFRIRKLQQVQTS